MRQVFQVAILAILMGRCNSLVAQVQPKPPLEIRVSTPKWINGCLDLTVERANVSSQTIYVPEWEGLLFFVSTNLIHSDPGKKNENVWLPIYGLSDFVTNDARPMLAGSTITDHFCLPNATAVISQQKKTRRQVAVRGRAKIIASYFPTEDAWKAQQDRAWPKDLPKASLEVSLPCLLEPDCPADCTTPPALIEGEKVEIPDVLQFRADWNERGKVLSDELSRLHSACKK